MEVVCISLPFAGLVVSGAFVVVPRTIIVVLSASVSGAFVVVPRTIIVVLSVSVVIGGVVVGLEVLVGSAGEARRLKNHYCSISYCCGRNRVGRKLNHIINRKV